MGLLRLMRGDRVAFDLGMVQVDERVLSALHALRGDIWACVLRDSTSPVTLVIGLDHEVLDRAIRPVGHIPIPDFIRDLLAPVDFSHLVTRDLGAMLEISP